MKIQKVEIQAFRAYDKVENGTFDFSTKTNGVADFVSIYAPNGFGKTSFYDAVEWSYTNRITRFDRKKGFNAELAKSERNFYAESQNKREQWIIRNKFSEQEEGFVKLYTTSSETPYENKIPKVKKGESDYKYDRQKTVQGRAYFHEVLLSQELIDAFLKEDNAAVRYEKFIQSFGDVELDKKYRTIVDLIKVNQEKIDAINKELQGIQLKLNLDFDSELLIKINDAINEFNIQDQTLPRVDPHFSEKDILRLANLISEKREDLKTEIQRLRKREEEINDSISGKSDGQLSPEGYFETKIQLDELNTKLKDLQIESDLLDKHGQIQLQVSVLERELTRLLEEDKNLADLINIFPAFTSLKKAIADEERQIEVSKKDVSESKKTLNTVAKKIDELNADKNILQASYQKLADNLKQLPKIQSELANIEKSQRANDNLKKSQTKELEELKKLINKQEAEKRAFSIFIKDIKNDVFPTDEHQYYDKSAEYVSIINSAKEDLKKTEDHLVRTQTLLSEADSMNKELKALVEQGASIVNLSQTSNCPLCQQQYDSFSILAEKISNNSLLGQRINELLEEKGKWEIESDRLKRLINKTKDELVNRLSIEAETQKEALNKLTEQRNLLNHSMEELDKQTELLSGQLNEYLLVLGLTDAPAEGFEAKLGLDTETAKSELDKILHSLDESSIEKKKLEEQIQVSENQLKRSKERIQNIKEEQDYKRFLSFQQERMMESLPSKNDLDGIKATLKKEIEVTRKKLEEFKKELNDFGQKLIDADKDEIELAIDSLKAKFEFLRVKTLGYENLLSAFLTTSLSGLSKKQLLERLSQSKQEILAATNKIEDKLNLLSKIDAYRVNVIPYLEYKENQQKKKGLEEERRFLKGTVRKELKEEKERISEFIHNQVESFFYQDLINTLYRKIDPHPSYKKISFKCDFSTAKPMLNIFVSDDSENTIVPTLYFSTAQLNILSLSIFLAKALNVKDDIGKAVDCIFIDDPIQSMDSINILSTIDLFRSIVVNLGKQIILSTHDENFQNLLKKKIPADLFPSKFLELETFGKVKPSI